MLDIMLEGDENRIIVLDSVAHANDSCRGDIIIVGSHGGESAAMYLLQFRPRGAIFNDAGMGKSAAGIEGLDIFDALFLPAAAVDAFSARIGKGSETYQEGVISAVNQIAKSYGISVGMTAKEAAMKMYSNTKDKNIHIGIDQNEYSRLNNKTTGRFRN